MFGMSRIRHCTLWLVMLEKNDSIAIIQFIQKPQKQANPTNITMINAYASQTLKIW